MDPADLIAIVTGLLTPEPAPVFDALRDGGPNPGYPVVIEACEGPSLGFELEGHHPLRHRGGARGP